MLISFIHSLFIIISALFLTALISLASVLLSFFDSTGGNLAHRILARSLGKAILFVSGIKVEVRGLSNIELNKSYVYMPNHQSLYDIPVLLGRLPIQFRWLAKAELFKIPVFGRAMKGAGYISIDRKNRHSAIGSLNKAANSMKSKGVSVVIFPEGTRSLDGKIASFKKGGFYLASDSEVPIVPVIIKGTKEIVSKKSFFIKPGKVILEILEPVKTDGYSSKDKKVELLNKVRDILIEKHAALQDTD